MVNLFVINNPYNPQDGLDHIEIEPGVSLHTIDQELGFKDEPWLAVAYIDGKQFYPLREEWEDTILGDGDCVYFMPHVGFTGFMIILAVIAVAAIVIALSIQPPSTADNPEPDPVFDLKGQKNQIRLGHPIEDGYGKPRLWPSYATRAFNQYYGNDQFQFQLFCLGHGSWEIEEIAIEDTPIDQFQEIVYEVYQPGEQVILFPDNVETSVEVGQIELFGPNEEEHQGYTGPFVANAANTTTTHLEVDVVLPRGLYHTNDEGKLRYVATNCLFEYRLIDNNGNAFVPDNIFPTSYVRTIVEQRQNIGSSNLFSEWEEQSNVFEEEEHTKLNETVEVGPIVETGEVFDKTQTRETKIFYVFEGDGWSTLADFRRTLATHTPQRYTVQKDVPRGRYEVRAIRTNNKNQSHKAGDVTQWVGLRAFLPPRRDYGDVTMLAVKSRASNNLNDKSSNRINVVATRKLPLPDENGVLPAFNDYQSRVATRSPVWAMVNILRAPYGGNLEDRFLDLDFFISEAEIAETAGVYYDWIFDQRSTVWEAVKSPCFVNRAIPMLNGSLVSFVRDKPATVPTFFVNPENTKKNSFKLEKKLFDLQENDGLEVEYVDPITWKPEIVLCLLPGQNGNNPKRLKLQGVTDRQRAFDLGMYLWAKQTYEREQISVTTGLEGYIPTYGDLMRVSSDVPRWGQNGFVDAINADIVTLSEKVEFENGAVHKLALRGKLGQCLGPYTVTEIPANPRQVRVVGGLPADEFYFDFQNEPPYFIFGVSDLVGKVCRVVNMTPQESDGVQLKAIIDDQRRHSHYGDAPAMNQGVSAPAIPDKPVVSSVDVQNIPGSMSNVVVSWEPALGAVNYLIEQSVDGEEWFPVDTVARTTYTLPIIPGQLYVRVAGVNIGIGPFVSWSGEVGEATGPPDDLKGLVMQPPFTGVSAHPHWQPSAQASSYLVEIFTQGTKRGEFETTETNYEFTIDAAREIGAVYRTITFTVTPKNVPYGAGVPASITVGNPSPAKFLDEHLSSTLKNDVGTYRVHSISWPVSPGVDVSFYRVFGSETQGFTPGASNVIFEGLATGIDLKIDGTGNPVTYPPLYWRAAAVDVWGDDTNPSNEQTIS